MSKLSRGARAHYQPARLARAGHFGELHDAWADELRDEIASTRGAWELEIGFGKGRYLLNRAAADPEAKLLGIELVSGYFQLAADRARKRGLDQLVLMQGEALFLLSTWLPREFAKAIHIYFPDPWPKAKHHRRRLFAEETVDLLLDALTPDGELLFASDHLAYSERVLEVWQPHPAIQMQQFSEPWPDGARTNYEAKYIEEGRKITRLRITKRAQADGQTRWFHPLGREGILVGPPGEAEA